MNMNVASLILDAVLVLILGINVLVAWKRGFVKSIRGFISYLISFALANSLHKLLAVYIIRLPFLQAMVTGVKMPEWDEATSFMDKVNVFFRYLQENAVLTDPDSISETIREVVSQYVAEILASLIAFILIFIVSMLLLKLLLWLLNLIATKTPGVKQANGILGALVGLLIGFFWTYLLSNLVSHLALPILIEKMPDTFTAEMADSAVMRFFTTFNPVAYLIRLINLLSL